MPDERGLVNRRQVVGITRELCEGGGGGPGECCIARDVYHRLMALNTESEQAYAEGCSDGGKAGHADERKRIADWLRQQSCKRSPHDCADDIADGDHWKTPTGEEPF